jgi:hypothetical protein
MTVTLGYNAPSGFVAGETVTPAKLNSLGQPVISAIVNNDISNSAAIAGSKVSPNFGAQNVVTTGAGGFGTATPNAVAALDVTSTTKGLLPPRMTGTQRDAIAAPPAGLMLYNSTTNKLQVRTDAAWVDLH